MGSTIGEMFASRSGRSTGAPFVGVSACDSSNASLRVYAPITSLMKRALTHRRIELLAGPTCRLSAAGEWRTEDEQGGQMPASIM